MSIDDKIEKDKLPCKGKYYTEKIDDIKYVCSYSVKMSPNDYERCKKCPYMDKEYEIPIDWTLSYYFYTCSYKKNKEEKC